MKNRKTVVVAFLLVAAMLLGVGYAALTDTLTVVGNATIDMTGAQSNFDEKIFFSDSGVLTHGTGNTAGDQTAYTADDATYQLHSLATKDESASLWFEISNTSNVPVLISVAANNPTNNNAEYFAVSYEYFSNKELTVPTTLDTPVAATNGKLYVKVTVTVAKPVTTQTTGTFGLSLNVTTEIPTP